MLTTLFGIALATGLRTQTNEQLQKVVDTQQGIYVHSEPTNCQDTKLVASHSFNKLGEKIANLQMGSKVKFDGCIYKATNYEIFEIQKTKMVDVFKDKNTLYLQTCVDDGNQYTMVVTMKLLKPRVLKNK